MADEQGKRRQDPYSKYGVADISTESSTLISSSKFLNTAALREALPTALLRRNGRDRRPGWDSQHLVRGLLETRDDDRINSMFAEARRADPRLDAWFAERHISTFVRGDLAHYPEGSLGAEMYNYLAKFDLEPNLHPRLRQDPNWRPTTDLEFWEVRRAQTHDFDHLTSGVGFSYLAEMVPIFMRIENSFAHLDAELAAALSDAQLFVILPIITRTMLHYPRAWTAVTEYMRYAVELGRSAPPLHMVKYEDLLHLTLPEVRAAIGLSEVSTYDTFDLSDYWSEGAQSDPEIKGM
jgi:ubiquinone biosynthesis protein Coq4